MKNEVLKILETNLLHRILVYDTSENDAFSGLLQMNKLQVKVLAPLISCLELGEHSLIPEEAIHY